MLIFAIGALDLALFPEADVASLVLSFAFLAPTSFAQTVLVRFATFEFNFKFLHSFFNPTFHWRCFRNLYCILVDSCNRIRCCIACVIMVLVKLWNSNVLFYLMQNIAGGCSSMAWRVDWLCWLDMYFCPWIYGSHSAFKYWKYFSVSTLRFKEISGSRRVSALLFTSFWTLSSNCTICW